MNNSTLVSASLAEDYLKEIDKEITPLRVALIEHQLYELLVDKEALSIFLSHHVYCVFDFMCLVKALQTRLTSTDLIWLPPKNINAARLINEIVLGEETDELPNGQYSSHFELYLAAMNQIGVKTGIKDFYERLEKGESYLSAMALSDTPIATAFFVLKTLAVCDNGSLPEIAAYFLFGRENLIPDIFPKLIDSIAAHEEVKIDLLLYYIERHIEIDSGEHEQASRQLLIELCGNDSNNWDLAKIAATAALESRLELWDAIAETILKEREKAIVAVA